MNFFYEFIFFFRIKVNVSGPLLVSRTGDLGWTRCEVKMSKCTLTLDTTKGVGPSWQQDGDREFTLKTPHRTGTTERHANHNAKESQSATPKTRRRGSGEGQHKTHSRRIVSEESENSSDEESLADKRRKEKEKGKDKDKERQRLKADKLKTPPNKRRRSSLDDEYCPEATKIRCLGQPLQKE